MSTKHTPGPYRAEGTKDSPIDRLIAHAKALQAQRDELLAALRDLVGQVEAYASNDTAELPDLELARITIAKATERQS